MPNHLNLMPSQTEGAQVQATGPNAWRLKIPPGRSRAYRLAQLDDYGDRPRRSFPWRPPVRLSLEARASSRSIPGTWGFGLWNNPFGMAILSGAEALRLPALPQAAWFFFAGPPNWLSLRDDLPAQGWLAGTFCSAGLPLPLLAPGGLLSPLLLAPPGRRLLRRLARPFVRQDSLLLEVDPTGWHAYQLDWQPGRVVFSVDGVVALTTPVSPRPPLGLVLWVDNQFAALDPRGRMAFGTLANPEPAWMELQNLKVTTVLDNQGATV